MSLITQTVKDTDPRPPSIPEATVDMHTPQAVITFPTDQEKEMGVYVATPPRSTFLVRILKLRLLLEFLLH